MHVATRICHTDIVVLSQSPVMGAMAEAGGGDGGGGASWDKTKHSAAGRRESMEGPARAGDPVGA